MEWSIRSARLSRRRIPPGKHDRVHTHWQHDRDHEHRRAARSNSAISSATINRRSTLARRAMRASSLVCAKRPISTSCSAPRWAALRSRTRGGGSNSKRATRATRSMQSYWRRTTRRSPPPLSATPFCRLWAMRRSRHARCSRGWPTICRRSATVAPPPSLPGLATLPVVPARLFHSMR